MIIEDLRTVEYFSDFWNFLAGFQMNIFETGLLRFFDASIIIRSLIECWERLYEISESYTVSHRK